MNVENIPINAETGTLEILHCVTVTMSHLAAFDAFCCELLLVALGAVDVMLFGDEALGADGVLASAAHETLFMPLPGLVLHLLHAGLTMCQVYWRNVDKIYKP